MKNHRIVSAGLLASVFAVTAVAAEPTRLSCSRQSEEAGIQAVELVKTGPESYEAVVLEKTIAADKSVSATTRTITNLDCSGVSPRMIACEQKSHDSAGILLRLDINQVIRGVVAEHVTQPFEVYESEDSIKITAFQGQPDTPNKPHRIELSYYDHEDKQQEKPVGKNIRGYNYGFTCQLR